MLETLLAKQSYQVPKLEEHARYVVVTGLSGAPMPGDLDFAPDFLDGPDDK